MSTEGARGRTGIAAQWRSLRRVYPIYCALAVRFQLSQPPFADLNLPASSSEPEVMSQIESWLAELDDRLRAYQFRQLLENSDAFDAEQKLHALLERYLRKTRPSDADRDKLDFLLSHYFTSCAPPSYHERAVEYDDVAEVLAAILPVEGKAPAKIAEPLEELIRSAEALKSLREFVASRIIERGRALKVGAGASYFEPAALAAFTRFNYQVRRSYVRLVDADLEALRKALEQLQKAGAENVNCSEAGMGNETIEHLLELVRDWKRPRLGDYLADQSFRSLMELRAIAEREQQSHRERGNRGVPDRISALESEVRSLTDEIAGWRAEWRELREQMLRINNHAGNPGPSFTSPADVMPEVEVEVEKVKPAVPQAARPAKTEHAPAASAPSAAASAPMEAPQSAAPAAAEKDSAELASLLDRQIADISNHIGECKSHRGNPSTVPLGGTALLLSEAELFAYSSPATDAGDLRRCVAARALLVAAAEASRRGGDGVQLQDAIAAARGEVARFEAYLKAAPAGSTAQMSSSHRQLGMVLQQVGAARKR